MRVSIRIDYRMVKSAFFGLYINSVYVDLTRSGVTSVTRSVRPLSCGWSLRIVIVAITFSFGAI
jgi:hypothetical protein